MIHAEMSFEVIPDGDEAAGCNHCRGKSATYRLTVVRKGERAEYMQFCDEAAEELYHIVGKKVNPEEHEG